MKKARRFIAALLAALSIISAAGCSALDDLKRNYSRTVSGGDASSAEDDNVPERIEILLEALDKRDGELFKSVFSKTALSLADDLDKGLEYIFGIYEGEYSRTAYSNYSSTRHYGEKKTALVNPIYVIQTSAGRYYRIRYSVWTVQEVNPDSVGIYSLDVTECEEDTRGGGGGSWLAGISYPGRKGAEAASDGIATTMITGNEKHLREVMSDELLATDGIDRRIAEFASGYSSINPSTVGDCWLRVREDGMFGYMVVETRPVTFIVFKMSDTQPDRISGMKVTIVPVNESLPQTGIEPDGLCLDFPKFPTRQ